MAAGESLGYIVIEAEEGLFRGAALVADFRGIPVDFRYTEPIRPTKIEKVLYGNALDVYLKEELILESLVGAVEAKPALWICKESNFLAPIKNATKSKTVVLASTTKAPLDAVGDFEPTAESGVFFVQADSVSAPLKVTFPSNVAQNEVKATMQLLVDAAATMELLEPFARMQKAFNAIISDGEDGK